MVRAEGAPATYTANAWLGVLGPRHLQTLVVLLSTQLKHPSEPRYHKINTQNANIQKLLAQPGSESMLRALGFAPAEDTGAGATPAGSGNAFWLWREGQLPDRDACELLARQRDALARRAASLSAASGEGG